MRKRIVMFLISTVILQISCGFVVCPLKADDQGIQLVWDQKIPARDGVKLSAVIWKPRVVKEPLPAIVTITPYGAQRTQVQATFFAKHGYVVVAVDSRGRGNSEGVFRPFRDDGSDGYDVVEWVARQRWCNGKIGTWGGSYSGFNQWATLKFHPPHLKAAIPFASGGIISDIPLFNNIVPGDLFVWLTLVSGRIMNTELTGDESFWNDVFKDAVREGKSFRDVDVVSGNTSTLWREMLDHPIIDSYWESTIPSAADYQKIDIPILTITGHYDGDQGGALMYYNEFMKHASSSSRAHHYLVIGPWDHHGTLYNKDQVGSIKFGPNAVLQMTQLHVDWYDWALKGKVFPGFLKDKVSYYVAGRDEWRYAPELAGTHNAIKTYYLSSDEVRSPDLYHANYLEETPTDRGGADTVIVDPSNLQAVLDDKGPELDYYTAPLSAPLTVSGIAVFDAFIEIDQKDADFAVRLEEVRSDGSIVPLTRDAKRARYNKSLRSAQLVTPGETNEYIFSTFHFFTRQLAEGSRLRLRFSEPIGADDQRNMNTGGAISDETIKDARPVRITIRHDAHHPTRLILPVIQ
jgi:putative CocE/NonD family hydrolase